MLNPKTLGAYIRSLRLQNRMTQAQLAEKAGVTDKAVSKWERDLSYPDIALFPRLADILGVTVNDLLKESVGEGRPSRLLQILGMSHDIRTPLSIIIGCSNLAELHHEDPERLTYYLESIRISGEYLLRSIDRLMQVTYQEEDTADSKRYPGNVQELGDYLNHRAKARMDALQDFDFSGKRFLVADDIMLNREIAAEILEQAGAVTELAENGKEAVRMLEAAPAGYYDLILMDIMMPEMDGLEATRRIRKLEDPRKASVPIIAVSANVYEKDRKEAAEAGMDAFVEKPIFIDRLFETMTECLNKSAE